VYYYCDARCPHQKGAIEVNHGLIRRVLPKGDSFNHLSQEEITRMMDHINSYKRKKLNDRSPYETFSFYNGEEVLQKLGCSPVIANDILLKPIFSNDKTIKCAANRQLTTGTGVDSPITNKSRGSRPPFDMLVFVMILQENEKIKLHLGYISGISLFN
jgi:hypothetical protein